MMPLSQHKSSRTASARARRHWVSLAAVTIVVGSACAVAAWNNEPGGGTPEALENKLATTQRESHVASNDWPNLFGPLHNGVSPAAINPPEWSPSGPRRSWQVDIGRGYSSPVVRGDRVVVLHRQGDEEIVDCRSLTSGQQLWEFCYPTSYKCVYRYSDGPYSTPVLDTQHAYTISAQGVMHCLALDTGRVVWRRDLAADFQMREGNFAVGASPLLLEDRLIFNAGGRAGPAGIVALDTQTGATLWTATDHRAGYATPCAATIHGRRYVFVVTFEGLVALSPDDGQVEWEIPMRPKAPDSVNATSPVVAGDLVLMVTGPGPGAMCVRVLPEGGHEILWRDRRVLDSQFNNLIVVGQHVYGYSSRGQGGATFRCVELATGELCWKWASPLERGSGLAAGGRFILWGEHGHLALLDVSPHEPVCRAISREPLLPAPCYSAPAFAQGRLLVRNESKLVCFEVVDPDKL